MFSTLKSKTAIAVILLFTLLLILFFGSKRFMFNVTESIPLGLYLVEPKDNIVKGAYVAFCLDEEKAKWASLNQYVSSGVCPSKTSYLMKEVVAVPGDHVLINSNGVSVNEIYLDKSMPLKFDSKNRKMPTLKIDKVLNENEFLLMSNHSFGFDSRYLGEVKKENIYSVIKKFF